MREVTLATEFITLTEAAQLLGKSRPTIYAWIAKGLLTRYTVAGEAKVLLVEVESLRKVQDG